MKKKMKGNIRLQYFFLGVALMGLTAGTPHGGEADSTYQENFQEDYNIYSLSIPESLTFAGEDVPLNDPDVRERLDRELLVNTYWQSNTLLMIKRANRWLPEFKEIFREEGVPEDLVYLGLIESGFQNVVSPANAAGFWQFLSSTGEEYDLIIDGEVDERYHPVKSARAAAQYLSKAKEEFGSWTLAAASYNMGMAGVRRQLERQKVSNYYDLLLNSETARYVFRIIAVKEIISRPAEFGFHLRDSDMYNAIPTEKIEVSTAIESWPDWAQEHGINYKTLKYHNPWLREDYLRNRANRTYQIEVPTDKSFISTPE